MRHALVGSQSGGKLAGWCVAAANKSEIRVDTRAACAEDWIITCAFRIYCKHASVSSDDTEVTDSTWSCLVASTKH